MSSLNFKALARFTLVAGLSFGLSGCFQPLHAPTASGGSVQAAFASIEVPEQNWPENQAVFSHHLRSELVFLLNGSGEKVPSRYVLDMSFRQSLSAPIVDTETGRATSAILGGTLNYTLKSRDGSTVITQGTATGSVSYDRFRQRFATVRAARDAEIRLAKLLAEQVRTRLSAALWNRS